MSLLDRIIKDRLLKRNKNWLSIISGETGSGKSYTALKIGELVDPEFGIDRVVFTREEFMKLLNSGRLHKGNMVVWDEAGVGIPAREWQSISNKMINYLLQTFRHENLGVIFTTPSIDFIDIQLRKLFHNYIETQHINFSKKCVRTKFMLLEHNPRYGKIYFKYPRIRNDGWGIRKIKRMDFGKPSNKLIRAYERKKKRFTKELKREIEDTLKNEKERKDERKVKDIREIVHEIMENIDYYEKEYNKGNKTIDVHLIMAKFNVGVNTAKKIKSYVLAEIKRVKKKGKRKK